MRRASASMCIGHCMAMKNGMLRIRKGQREGNEEVRGELGATLGPILRTRDCPRCANVSIIIQFFTLFHVLKLHWRMVTVSSFCILWQPRQIHPHLRSASTYSSFTSNDLKHYDQWSSTTHTSSFWQIPFDFPSAWNWKHSVLLSNPLKVINITMQIGQMSWAPVARKAQSVWWGVVILQPIMGWVGECKLTCKGVTLWC